MTQISLGDFENGYSEVYLQKTEETHNIVWKEELLPQYQHLAHSSTDKEWSQIFDLGDTVCVCLVNGNQLDLRLIHLTTKPVDQLHQMLKDGVGRSTSVGQYYTRSQRSTFMHVEQDQAKETNAQKQHLRTVFQQFDRARLIFDSPIVRNLCISSNDEPAQNGVQSQANTFGRGEFRINLATQSNQIYAIQFDKYYLKQQETISVVKYDEELLMELRSRTMKAFDIVRDNDTQDELFVLGTSAYVSPDLTDPEQRAQTVAQTISQTLLFMKRDRTIYEVGGGQNQHGETQKGWIRFIRDKLSEIAFNPQNPNNQVQNKFQQSVGQSIINPKLNSKNMEGVVAIKSLSNNLIAVVYSNGLLSINNLCSTSRQAVVVSTTLLSSDKYDRIVDAQIAFRTHDAVLSDSMTVSKSISLGVTFTAECRIKATKQTGLCTYSLKFQNFLLENDPEEDQIDLGNNASLTHVVEKMMPFNQVITSLTYCDDRGFIYGVTDQAGSRIESVLGEHACPIWDRASNENYEQIFDEVDLTPEQESDCPQYSEMLKEHYLARILKPGRFSVAAFETLLASEGLYDRNFSIKENIASTVKKASVLNVKKFLQNLIKLEKDNSRILLISEPLEAGRGLQWRVIIRPLGVSILTQTGAVSAYCHSRNRNLQLGDCTVADESFATLFKSSIVGSMGMFDEHLLQHPEGLRETALQVIQQRKNQAIELKLKKMLQDDPEKLVEEAVSLLTHLIEYFEELRDSIEEQQKSSIEPSAASLKVMERAMLLEIDSFYQIFRDYYLLALFLATKTHNKRCQDSDLFNRVETYVAQLAALKQALSSDLTTAVGEPATTHTQSAQYESSRYGTVFQGLIKTSQEKFNPEHQLIEGEFYSMQTLGKVLALYTHQQKHCSMVSNPGYMPQLVRSLCELGQYEAAYKYSRAIRANSLVLQFMKVWSLANLRDSQIDDIQDHKDEFLSHCQALIYDTITLPRTAMVNVDIKSVLYNMPDAKRTAVVKEIDSLSEARHKKHQFLLACAYQLSKIRYPSSERDKEFQAAIFIIMCLQLDTNADVCLPNWEPRESDFFYECLFKSQKDPQLLYKACVSMRNLEKRQKCLLNFFEAICEDRGGSPLIYQFSFQQNNITLLVEALQATIHSLIDQLVENQRLPKVSVSASKKLEIERYVLIYQNVAEHYSWQDQFCKFMWYLHDQKLAKLLQISTSSQTVSLQAVLEIDIMLLGLTFEVSHNAGEDFCFYTNRAGGGTSQAKSAGKKRGFGDLTKDSGAEPTKKNTQVDSLEQTIAALEIAREAPHRFKQGNLTKVTHKTIKAAYLLQQAQLECLGIQRTQDVSQLSKILTELGKADLAVQLSIAHEVSPAYPIATHLQQMMDSSEEEEDIEEFKKQKIEDYLVSMLQIVPEGFINEIAQYLISSGVNIPSALSQRLVTCKQVSHVVGCLLSDEKQDVVQAMSFVTDNQQAIKILIETDLSLCVYLLQQAQESIAIFKDVIKDKKLSIEELKGNNVGFKIGRTFSIESQGAVFKELKSVQSAMDQDNIIQRILSEDKGPDYGDSEAEKLKKDVQKFTESIAILEKGQDKITQQLRQVIQ